MKSIKIGEDYLERWYLIPRNRFLNIYLHKFTGSDDDRALHDHPWWSVSFCLKGIMCEQYESSEYMTTARLIRKFFPYVRKPTHMHRMHLVSDSAWTIFITGPRVRQWGFRHNGWTSSKEFLDA
jgi:hypothetical protein